MTRHVTFLRVKALGSGEDRIIEGWASTPNEDRMGDVVVPEGARYQLPLPLLFAHKHEEPVGSVISATVTRAGIRIRAKLTEGVARAEEVWKLIKDGALQAVSIGFAPLKSTPLPNGGLRFDEWDWHELSIVSVPANPDAKIAIGKSVAYAADPQAVRVTPKAEPVAVKVTPQMAEAKAADMGGDYWQQMTAGGAAALALLPPEVAALADRQGVARGSCDNYLVSDRAGRSLAVVKGNGEVILSDQPHKPQAQPERLTQAQRGEVRRMIEQELSAAVLGVGKTLGSAIKDADAKLAKALVHVAEKVERLEASALHDGGFYTEGKEYRKGAVVVNDGQAWLATENTEATPGRGAQGWRLLARKVA